MVLQVICWILTFVLGHISSGGFTPSCMTGRRHAAKDLISSILAPMFLRLASDHEQLLAYEPAVQESADMVVQPEQAALVWQLIAGETRTELWTFLLIFSSAISQLQAHLLYTL